MDKLAKPIPFLAILIFASCLVQTNVQGQEGQFCGSKNSDVYHYPNCTYVSRINPSNLIWFANYTDALAAVYRPCEVCKPPPLVVDVTSTPNEPVTPSPTVNGEGGLPPEIIAAIATVVAAIVTAVPSYIELKKRRKR